MMDNIGHPAFIGEGFKRSAKRRKRSKNRQSKVVNFMAKGKRERKPVTVETAVNRMSVILAGLNSDDRKRAIKGANKLLRVAQKLNGGK